MNIFCLYFGTDSLLNARTGLQVASSKYAHWNPSESMALWAYGFSHQFKGNQDQVKEGTSLVWGMLPQNQWWETISRLRALWFCQAWCWLDMFYMLGKFQDFLFSQDVLHIYHSFFTAYFCCSALNCTSFNSVYGFNSNIRGFKNWAWNIIAPSKYYSYSLKLKISSMPRCYELGAHMASF